MVAEDKENGMKSSILRVLRHSVLALLCLSILTSAGTAFAATADTSESDTAASSSSSNSVNWSGYEATGHVYNKVQSTITMPTITCTAPGAESLFWVGFGGTDSYGTTTIEQDGIGAKCSTAAKPTVSYFAWWQMWNNSAGSTMNVLPATTLSVRPGQRVFSEVVFNPNTGGYSLELTNQTTGQKAFNTTKYCAAGYTCPRQTANWIAERYVFSNGNYTPLAKWSYYPYTFNSADAYTRLSTKLAPITAYSHVALNMISTQANQHRLATTSAISGNAFSVSWVDAQ
jgi:hypothetical protein